MTNEELLSQLKVGVSMPVSVKTKDGRCLVKKGAILTDNLIDKLKTWLTKSNVIIEQPKSEMSDTSDEELMKKTEDNLKKVFQVPVWDLSLVIDDIKVDIREISRRLSESIEWTYDDDIHYHHKSSNTEHYVRVAKLAIVLSNLYNQEVSNNKKIDLESVATAALLQNYGKKFENDEEELKNLSLDSAVIKNCDIPANLLTKPYDNEYHTVYAYAALASVLPRSIRTMILLSKTKDNFSKRFDQTDPNVIAGKIINLCEIYDILLEKVIMDNVPVPLENVISYMAQLTLNGTLDKNIYDFFLYHVPAFKNGTRVRLSSGEEAVVVSSTPEFRTRPTVLTLPHMKSPVLVNLVERTDLVIESVIYENKTLNKTTDYVQSQIEDVKIPSSTSSESALPKSTNSKKIILLNRVKDIIKKDPDDSHITNKQL